MRQRLRQVALDIAAGVRAQKLLVHRQSPEQFRVVNFHGTPSNERLNFREMVGWAREHFELLTPEAFDRVLSGQSRTPSRPSIIFTFDDGLRSNFDVAAEVLEEHGTRGWFFVNPLFAESSPRRHRAFFTAHVRYLTDPRTMAAEDYTPMSRGQIRDLAARGHAIGSHTLSHALLDGLVADENANEIGVSRRVIEAWTGVPCRAFAWTFAWNAIDLAAWDEVRKHYSYCFGACPGLNRFDRLDPHLIHRTNAESSMRVDDFALMASGLADAAWARRRRVLEARLRTYA